MLKTVVKDLINEIKMEIEKVKVQEMSDDTINAYIFLKKQLNYIKEVQKKIEEEEQKKDE